MFSLNNINFTSVIWGDVVISPRIEKIITPPYDCENIEVLCSVVNQETTIAAYSFFQNLTASEHVQLFKLILTAVLAEPSIKTYTVSLNTPIQVIRRLDELLPLFHSHNEQKVALELLESDIQELGAYEYGLLDEIGNISNISLWLDDFGNNQSNFDIVLSKKVKFCTIKVAKELFWGLLDADIKFLKSLLTFLNQEHSLIVEGVETQKHVEFISNIKGVKIQGFYYNPQLETSIGVN